MPIASTPYTVATLAPAVNNRLEETTPPVFWAEQPEVYSALIEAINDLTLLVGRPVQSVQVPLSLQPNSVWQAVPRGIFLITDIYGPQSLLRKTTLHGLDYVQASWGADWENDTDPAGPDRWAPIGLTLFAVHPAPTAAQIVNINAIPYPATDGWPYTGTEGVPFQDEFFEALEEYAAHYCRIKEGGVELQESMSLYASYLKAAQRMSSIQDRQDPLIFSPAWGGASGLNSATQR